MRFVLFTFSSGIVRREYMLRIVKPSFYPGGFCFIYVYFRRGSREYMRKAFLLSRRLLLYLRLLQTRQSGICVKPSFYPGGFCFFYVYFRRYSREYMRFVLFTFSSGVVRREYMLRIVNPSFYPGGFCFIYFFPYLLRNPFRKYLTDFQNINKPFFTL